MKNSRKTSRTLFVKRVKRDKASEKVLKEFAQNIRNNSVFSKLEETMKELSEHNKRVYVPIFKDFKKHQEVFQKAVKNAETLAQSFKPSENIAKLSAEVKNSLESAFVARNMLSDIQISPEMLAGRNNKTYLSEDQIDLIAARVSEKMIKGRQTQFAKKFINIRDNQLFCKSKLIDFPDLDSVYVKVVEAFLSIAGENGFCSIEIINDYLEDAGFPKLKSKQDKAKRIHNALTTLYRERKSQKKPFPKRAPDGKKIIELVKGKGWVFHNPSVE